MKKVIFVGGTSFSGSTLLHLMLANDPKGFALGEIRWLFRPQRADQIVRDCGCGDPSCTVWQQIRRNGESHVYETVFDLFPEVEFIVDSSKQPFWIRSQSDRLARRGIEAKQVLIWKTPLEFAASNKKRNRLEGWDHEWISYHRLYFSLIQGWKAVPYAQLTKDENTLRKVCEFVGIPWSSEKPEYWHRQYHAFGGNRSATFHLYDTETAKVHLKDHYDKNKMRLYRRIYENRIEDQSLEQIVEQHMANQPLFQPILQVLERNSVFNDTSGLVDVGALQLPAWRLNLRKLRLITKEQVARYKLRRQMAATASS
jgi:hypothetical protein